MNNLLFFRIYTALIYSVFYMSLPSRSHLFSPPHNIRLIVGHKLLIDSSCNFLSLSIYSFFLSSDFLLSALLSHVSNLRSSFTARDQVSYLCET
jgi:hypothetical protein